MINMNIYSLNTYSYQTKNSPLPIMVILFADQEFDLAEKIDLEEILLCHIDDEEMAIGAYCKSHLSFLKDTFKISKESPHFLVYDVRQYDCYHEVDLIPGEYEIFIKLNVYQKAEDGEFIKHVLEAKHRLQLVQ